MENFSSIECFVRSAEVRSFAEAARRLSLTPSAVGNVSRSWKRDWARVYYSVVPAA